MTCVLDASAVLALMNGERGAETVAERLPGSIMSLVNAIEVGTKLIDKGLSNEDAWEAIELLDIALIQLDLDQAGAATALRTATRAKGLSLADRTCLALATREGLSAVTADRAWAALDLGCEIELIR